MDKIREKLKEVFEFCIDDPYCMPDVDEFIDKLAENGVTVQEWIPVTERLPEVARRVLVTDGENISFGYVLNYERKALNPWCTQSPCLPHTTTHWMPLPTPPKGE